MKCCSCSSEEEIPEGTMVCKKCKSRTGYSHKTIKEITDAFGSYPIWQTIINQHIASMTGERRAFCEKALSDLVKMKSEIDRLRKGEK